MRTLELSNPLQPNSFQFVIDGMEEFAFTLQSCELPPISLSAVPTNFRGHQGFATGDRVTVSSASLNFIVDEQMVGFLSVHDWIYYAAREDIQDNASKDIVVLINDASNNQNIECRLVNCIPVSLSGISLTTENSDPLTATLDVELDYVEYKIVR